MPDTIYALASAQGRCGVAVIRISGPFALGTFAVMGMQRPPLERRVYYTSLKYPEGGTLDKILVVYFRAPHSFTGEDIVELYVHGSRAILTQIFHILDSIKNVRMAQPGEFCKRAFMNGKMDLTEAEGLIDLINAETKAQMLQAQHQVSGSLGKMYKGWADALLALLAHCEAYIDFPEEILSLSAKQSIHKKLVKLIAELSEHIDDNHRGERIREGIKVAVIGPPNAGKSSLINLLAKRDVAIVSNRMGTTRDSIEVLLDIHGYPVRLFDSAGIRETEDALEAKSIERTFTTIRHAHILLLVIDGCTQSIAKDFFCKIGALADRDAPIIILANKCDRAEFALPEQSFFDKNALFAISTLSNAGIESFLCHLQQRIESSFSTSFKAPMITRHRHRTAIKICLQHLQRALSVDAPELFAEDLRMATRQLEQITGQTTVEDTLDIIFQDFCIGK